MNRESKNSKCVVSDLGALVGHTAKDLPAQQPVAEQARRELLRAQAAFMKAQAEGRIPADAKFPYEEFSRARAPIISPDTEPLKKQRPRKCDLVPVVTFLILGWGVELLLPRRFLDFFRGWLPSRSTFLPGTRGRQKGGAQDGVRNAERI